MILEALLKNVRGTKGVLYQANLTILRHHIKAITEDQLIQEIQNVNDPALFNYLHAAGIPSQKAIDAMTERFRELMK